MFDNGRGVRAIFEGLSLDDEEVDVTTAAVVVVVAASPFPVAAPKLEDLEISEAALFRFGKLPTKSPADGRNSSMVWSSSSKGSLASSMGS